MLAKRHSAPTPMLVIRQKQLEALQQFVNESMVRNLANAVRTQYPDLVLNSDSTLVSEVSELVRRANAYGI